MPGADGGNAVTFHSQVCIVLPLELIAIALTFQIPGTALELVYDDSLTPVWLKTSVPLRYHFTFTVWFTDMLNVLLEPSVLLAGDNGA